MIIHLSKQQYRYGTFASITLNIFPFNLDDFSIWRVDFERFVFHFEDDAGDPITVLQHNDISLHRSEIGQKENCQKAERQKHCGRVLEHQSGFDTLR